MLKIKREILLVVLFLCGGSILNAAQPVIDTKSISAIQKNTAALEGHSVLVEKGQYRQWLETANHTVQLTKTVSTLETQIKQLEDQLKAMTENLSRANGFDRLTESLLDQIKAQTPSFSSTRDIKTGEALDPTKMSGIERILDQTIPSKGTIGNRRNYEKVHQAYVERARKSAIESAELYINNAPERIQQVTDTAMIINETNSLKDSVDLNNRLVAELLRERVEGNIMLAKYIKIDAATHFSGEVHPSQDKVGTDTYEEYLNKRSKPFPLRVQ